MNWRKFPHPTYGNYGGRTNKGSNYSEQPIDGLDAIFMLHDVSLRNAGENKYKLSEADSQLFRSLKKVNFLKLKIPVYGQVYWIGSLVVFGVRHYFFRADVTK